MDLKSFRAQYPQYDNVPDQELVTSLHNKFYSQMPIEDFASKIGFTSTPQEPQEDNSSDFIRGIKSWYPQTKQLIGGTEVLAGKAFNAPGLIEYGADVMKNADTEMKTKATDSFSEAKKRGVGAVVTDWLPYQAGAGVSNILEVLASSAIGGAAGTMFGPEGTAAGAITGAVERKLLKKGIMEKAEKIIDEQAKKAFIDKEAKIAAKEINKELGSNIGIGIDAALHGTGEVTQRAVQEAEARGEHPEDINLSKVLPAAAGHAITDFVADKIGLAGLGGKLSEGGKSIIADISKNIAITGTLEVPPEVAQTALERYGANLSLTEQQAITEYIDTIAASYAMTAIPGGVGGVKAHYAAQVPPAPEPGKEQTDTNVQPIPGVKTTKEQQQAAATDPILASAVEYNTLKEVNKLKGTEYDPGFNAPGVGTSLAVSGESQFGPTAGTPLESLGVRVAGFGGLPTTIEGGTEAVSTTLAPEAKPAFLTKDTLLDSLRTSTEKITNPSQVKNFLKKNFAKTDLSVLEAENPTLTKDLFSEYLKSQKQQQQQKETEARLLKLEEANTQAVDKNKQERQDAINELIRTKKVSRERAEKIIGEKDVKAYTQEEYDAMHPYLKTVSEFGREAPLSVDKAIETAAAEEAFLNRDLRDVEGFEVALAKMAEEKTAEAKANRKAEIQRLMNEQKITEKQAERRVGNNKNKEFNFTKDRPFDYLTENEYFSLQEKFEGKKQPTDKQTKEANLRRNFIKSLSPEQQAIAQQKIQERLEKDSKLNQQRIIQERQQKAPQGTEITPEGVDINGDSIKEFNFQNIGTFLANNINRLKGSVNIVYGNVIRNRPGMFDPSTNTITIDKKNLGNLHEGQVIIHEMMHYMLDHIIDNKNVAGLLSGEQKAALNRLENIRKEVVRKLGSEFKIHNLKEFIAEAFSNQEFQHALASLEPLAGPIYKRISRQDEVKALAKKENISIKEARDRLYSVGIIRRIADAIINALGLTHLKPKVLEETLDLVQSIITDERYQLPSEKISGKTISFAPRQAGQPRAVVNPAERVKTLPLDEHDIPGSIDTLKKAVIGERARDYLIKKFQNSRYAIKKWQRQMEMAGKLIVGGANFNDIYNHIVTSFGEANFRQKEYLDEPIQKLQDAIDTYAKASGQDINIALKNLHQYAEALHEEERRTVKFLKNVPLDNTHRNIPYQGEMITAADMRKVIFETLAQDQALSDQQIQAYRAYLENLVATHKDVTGYSPGHYKTLDINGPDYNVTADLNVDDRNAILAYYDNNPNKAEMDAALAALKPVQDATRELNRQGNYWSNATDNITKFYGWEHYIPLKGKKYAESKMPANTADLEPQDARLSYELKESPETFEGRVSEADNPIIQTLTDSSLSAARAGRRDLTQSIKNAVEQGLLEGKVDDKYHYTAQQVFMGLPEEAHKLIKQRSVIVHHNPDGSMDLIQIKDPAQLEAIRRTYQEGHPLIDMANNWTSWVGQTHTRYNPAFPVLNFVRDSLTNAFSMAVDMGPLTAAKFIGAVSTDVAHGGLFKTNKVMRLFNKGGKTNIDEIRRMADTDPYIKDMLDYLEHGGMVSYLQGLSVRSQFQDMVKQIGKHKVLKTKEQIDGIFDAWVSTFEIAARVSAYKTAKNDALAKGASQEQAIHSATVYAKQLANFEEVGEWGKGLGAMFMFFRPSATGAVRAFESIGPMLRSWDSVKNQLPTDVFGREGTRTPEQQQALDQYETSFMKQRKSAMAVTAGLMGAGATIYLMAAAMSDDDDEGRNKVINDDLGRWTRFARFDIGDGQVFQIPWGFGLGAFAATGAQVAGATMSTSNTMGDTFSNIINIGLDTFVPLPVSRMKMTDNPAAFVMDSITPTLARPFLEYTMNLNSLGQEIYNNRQSRYGDAYTGGDNIPEMFKDAARLLADVTNGGVDWSPNTMYFFANNYFDGYSRLVHNGYGLAQVVGGKDALNATQNSLIFQSFVSKLSNVDQREFARTEKEVQDKEKIINMFKESNPEKYMEYSLAHPFDIAMVDIYNKQVGGTLNGLRSDANSIRRIPGLDPIDRKALLEQNREAQNLVKRQIVDSMQMFKDIED